MALGCIEKVSVRVQSYHYQHIQTHIMLPLSYCLIRCLRNYVTVLEFILTEKGYANMAMTNLILEIRSVVK
jgi:hypothetical protein